MATKNFSLERSLKSIHGWLGVLILPWVIIIGLTGIYLNHAKFIKSYLPNSQKADISVIANWPDPQPVGKATARRIAITFWPHAFKAPVVSARYRGQFVHEIKVTEGSLYFVKATGHYWVSTSLWRDFYSPTGHKIHRYFKWTGLLKRLHTDGWWGGAMGSWLADITAAALVLFAFSGLILFIKPRLRRRRNRQARRVGSFPSNETSKATGHRI